MNEPTHNRANLEAYIAQSEARLKNAASAWMRAEIQKGIDLARAELATLAEENEQVLPASAPVLNSSETATDNFLNRCPDCYGWYTCKTNRCIKTPASNPTIDEAKLCERCGNTLIAFETRGTVCNICLDKPAPTSMGSKAREASSILEVIKARLTSFYVGNSSLDELMVIDAQARETIKVLNSLRRDIKTVQTGKKPRR